MPVGDRITVAFCRTSSGDLTGTPKMILRLATGLDNEQFRPRIITQTESEFANRAYARSIPVEIVPYRGILDTYERGLVSVSPIQNVLTGLRILQYNYEVRDALFDVDVIWCDDVRMVLTLAPTIALTDATVILNIGLGIESEGVYKWMNDLSFRLVDHIFIESETQARRLYDEQFDTFREKFTIFHKGIDTQNFAPTKEQTVTNDNHNNRTIRIGTAATLTKRKGHLDAIDAIAKVIERFPETSIEYTIAGGTSRDGHQEYETRLKQRISDHDIEDIVEFAGWVDPDDMPAFYDSLDIFVLASEGEGIPGVVREALAMECAVVATDVGGTSEAVIDGETGLLVPPNDPEALADAITTLISEPEMRRRLAKNGREHIVSNFSVESYVDNYEEFFNHIVL